jgi:hypothetical protein
MRPLKTSYIRPNPIISELFLRLPPTDPRRTRPRALIATRLKLSQGLLERFKKRFLSSADVALIAEALVVNDDIKSA